MPSSPLPQILQRSQTQPKGVWGFRALTKVFLGGENLFTVDGIEDRARYNRCKQITEKYRLIERGKKIPGHLSDLYTEIKWNSEDPKFLNPLSHEELVHRERGFTEFAREMNERPGLEMLYAHRVDRKMRERSMETIQAACPDLKDQTYEQMTTTFHKRIHDPQYVGELNPSQREALQTALYKIRSSINDRKAFFPEKRFAELQKQYNGYAPKADAILFPRVAQEQQLNSAAIDDRTPLLANPSPTTSTPTASKTPLLQSSAPSRYGTVHSRPETSLRNSQDSHHSGR